MKKPKHAAPAAREPLSDELMDDLVDRVLAPGLPGVPREAILGFTRLIESIDSDPKQLEQLVSLVRNGGSIPKPAPVGQQAIDKLLAQVAPRLAELVGDLVTLYGSDAEFGLFVCDSEHEEPTCELMPRGNIIEMLSKAELEQEDFLRARVLKRSPGFLPAFVVAGNTVMVVDVPLPQRAPPRAS